MGKRSTAKIGRITRAILEESREVYKRRSGEPGHKYNVIGVLYARNKPRGGVYGVYPLVDIVPREGETSARDYNDFSRRLSFRTGKAGIEIMLLGHYTVSDPGIDAQIEEGYVIVPSLHKLRDHSQNSSPPIEFPNVNQTNNAIQEQQVESSL